MADGIKSETPSAFGMHPNAEIGFRSLQSDDLISSILSISLAANLDSVASDGINSQQIAETAVQDIQESFREIKLETITGSDNLGLYQFVLQQECEHLTLLVAEILSTLSELNSGFKGKSVKKMPFFFFSKYSQRV